MYYLCLLFGGPAVCFLSYIKLYYQSKGIVQLISLLNPTSTIFILNQDSSNPNQDTSNPNKDSSIPTKILQISTKILQIPTKILQIQPRYFKSKPRQFNTNQDTSNSNQATSNPNQNIRELGFIILQSLAKTKSIDRWL